MMKYPQVLLCILLTYVALVTTSAAFADDGLDAWLPAPEGGLSLYAIQSAAVKRQWMTEDGLVESYKAKAANEKNKADKGFFEKMHDKFAAWRTKRAIAREAAAGSTMYKPEEFNPDTATWQYSTVNVIGETGEGKLRTTPIYMGIGTNTPKALENISGSSRLEERYKKRLMGWGALTLEGDGSVAREDFHLSGGNGRAILISRGHDIYRVAVNPQTHEVFLIRKEIYDNPKDKTWLKYLGAETAKDVQWLTDVNQFSPQNSAIAASDAARKLNGDLNDPKNCNIPKPVE